MDKRAKQIRDSVLPETPNGEISIKEIPASVIKRYDLKVGSLSPFGRLKVVD